MDLNNHIDKKCAPGKKYENGSCFSIESLKKIALNYNEKIKTKCEKTICEQIDVNQSKENLVKSLSEKMADKCSEQTCWLRLDIVKELEDAEIKYNTFRPFGPSKKYEWLSTTHINEVIYQYHVLHDDFLFLGAVPSDFEDLPVLGISDLNFSYLENQNKKKIGIIINLDEHYKSGSHWVGLFINLEKNYIYYFDSVGKKPIKRIRKFINKVIKYMYKKKYNESLSINKLIDNITLQAQVSKRDKNKKKDENENDGENVISNIINGGFDIRYNHIQHQFKNSECGVYSINFIINLVDNKDFDYVIKNIIKDDEINKKRVEFFRNVDFKV